VGAKFIVDRRCPVKTSLTLTGLIEGIKQKGLLRRIHELAAGGTLPQWHEDARLEMVLPADMGLPGEITIKDLQRQTAGLLQHRVTCRQCPSSLNGHVGGCIAYVPYPLSEGLEYLLWTTAVQAMAGELPDALLLPAQSFALLAMQVRETPFADGMKARGDLLSQKPRLWQRGPVWKRERLSSAQVLELFFKNGVIAGEDLRVQAGFLEAALAVARALEKAVRDDEQRQALAEDTQPYVTVHDLMLIALDQGLGVYIWP
jgi:hypothetical protein